MRDEGRVRIMHYSWWLLGLREKGLCSISVFEASTLSPERERAGEIESETDGASRAGGVAFPEGRSRVKAAGGCRLSGGERGSNRVACNFEMDSIPPTNPLAPSPPSPLLPFRPPSIHRTASLPLRRSRPLRSFLRAELNWGGSTPFPSSRLLHVTEKEGKRKRERRKV